MRNLFDFLSKHNHWFLFVLLEVLSIVLLFKCNSYHGSVWFSSANAFAGKIYEIDALISQYFSLTHINSELTRRNIYLERQLALMTEELEKANPGDTTYLQRLQMSVMDGYTVIPAKVVNNSVNKKDNFITIDKGYADGVRKDMGVVCGNGIVGIVYLVSEHYSVLIPVLNSHSNISCTIRGRGYFGYLHWSGGTSGEAYVDDIPRHARFNIGDVVVTSGYSSVFPSGVVVGTVMHVYNSDNGLSYRIKVKLSTDFGRLRDVCVLNDSTFAERQKLLNAAIDSLKVR